MSAQNFQNREDNDDILDDINLSELESKSEDRTERFTSRPELPSEKPIKPITSYFKPKVIQMGSRGEAPPHEASPISTSSSPTPPGGQKHAIKGIDYEIDIISKGVKSEGDDETSEDVSQDVSQRGAGPRQMEGRPEMRSEMRSQGRALEMRPQGRPSEGRAEGRSDLRSEGSAEEMGNSSGPRGPQPRLSGRDFAERSSKKYNVIKLNKNVDELSGGGMDIEGFGGQNRAGMDDEFIDDGHMDDGQMDDGVMDDGVMDDGVMDDGQMDEQIEDTGPFPSKKTGDYYLDYNENNMTYEQKKLVKEELIARLKSLKAKGYLGADGDAGISMTKKISELRASYKTLKAQRDRDSSIMWQRHVLLGAVTLGEFANTTWNPFDLNLEGWSESVYESIDTYDDIFEELHEKWGSYLKFEPELKLIGQLGMSALMFHYSKTVFQKSKESMPNHDNILQQDPELKKRYIDASIRAMQNTQPQPQAPQAQAQPQKGAALVGVMQQLMRQPPPVRKPQQPIAVPQMLQPGRKTRSGGMQASSQVGGSDDVDGLLGSLTTRRPPAQDDDDDDDDEMDLSNESDLADD
jgi:Family of unknown function (DUF5767)